VLNPSMKLFIS